jgi:hypothetical protein
MYSLFIDVNSIDILHNIGIHKMKEQNSAFTSFQ